MTVVTEMGGIVMPPVPAFYLHPQTLDDVVTHTTGRALACLASTCPTCPARASHPRTDP